MPICKNPECKKRFKPIRPFQQGCCQDCDFEIAMAVVRKNREKAQAKAKKESIEKAKAKRQELRERKKQLETKSQAMKKAQASFNLYIRLRDRHEGCCSCPETNPPILHGGQWDCGHYLSVGACPELRFNEDNAHKQCKSCNGGSGRFEHKKETVTKEYRIRLIQKIGLKRVEALEGPHELPHWTKEDYQEIERIYKAKVKQIKAQIELENMLCH